MYVIGELGANVAISERMRISVRSPVFFFDVCLFFPGTGVHDEAFAASGSVTEGPYGEDLVEEQETVRKELIGSE